jgi:hypothetical protein
MSNETNTLIEGVETAERIAHLVNEHEHNAHKLAVTLAWTQDEHDYLNKERHRLNNSVKADDWRVKELLTEMYDAMVNNSCSHLWSIFVNDIAGMPNLATRRYGGTVTLRFHFTDLEIPGDIADWEIEDKILEALADNDDLNYGNEDGLSVDYEEE